MIKTRKITGLIILVLLGFMGYKAYDYYHSTYVGKTAYAYVPKKVPPKLEHKAETSVGDRSSWYSYDYKLTFVKEDGTTEIRAVSISQDNPKPLVLNSYVKATISIKRVLKGPNRIDEQAIPQKLRKKRTPLK